MNRKDTKLVILARSIVGQKNERELQGRRWINCLVADATEQFSAFGPKTPLDFPRNIVDINWVQIDPPDIRTPPAKLRFIFEVSVQQPHDSDEDDVLPGQKLPRKKKAKKLIPAQNVSLGSADIQTFPAVFDAAQLSLIFSSYNASSPLYKKMRNPVMAIAQLQETERHNELLTEAIALKVIERHLGRKAGPKTPGQE